MVLALIDVAAGSTLVFNLSVISSYIGYAMLVKGGWTVLTTFKSDFLFLLVGVLDCIAALILLLPSTFSSLSWVVGILIILKGVWSFLSSL
jgi:uncharacterized membrane protein HdeD (DUF308 family)